MSVFSVSLEKKPVGYDSEGYADHEHKGPDFLVPEEDFIPVKNTEGNEVENGYKHVVESDEWKYSIVSQ
jgi:hypothetical protein